MPFLRPKQTAAPTSPHPAAICTLTGNRTSRDSRRQHGHRTRHAAHNRTLRPYAITSCPEAEARLHAQRAQHARQHHCSRPTCSRMPHASGALAARYARPAGTQGVEGSVPVWHAPRRELKYLRTAGSAQYAEPCRAEVVQMSLSIGGTQACHRESHALHNAQGPGMSMVRQRWHIDVAFRHSYARESKRDRAHLRVRARCPRQSFAPALKNVLIAHRRR